MLKGSSAPTDFARQMARREIVFCRPTRWWQNGLTIGNGDVGGAAYGGGAASDGVIGIALNKVDVWDQRYDRKGNRVHTLAELRRLAVQHAATQEGRKMLNSLEPYGLVAETDWFKKSYPYPYAPPTCKPIGVVRLDPGAAFERVESRLSIHRGEVSFALGEAERGARVETFLDANSNVLAVRLRRYGDFDRPVAAQLSRYVDEQLGEPELGAEGCALWHRYVFPDGFTYAVYGLVAEGELAQAGTEEGQWRDIQAMSGWAKPGTMRVWEVEITAPERRATLTFSRAEGAVTVLFGIATSRESADPLACARELAENAVQRGFAGVQAEHRAWWDGFWSRSSLLVSDRMVESLWYQGLYVLACQSRGCGPPPIIGPGYQLPFGGWHGALITDYNVEMMYWPVFASNQLELARPFFEFFHRHMETMRADTRAFYDLPGLRFPSITDLTCRELSYLPCRNWQHVSAWMCQIYWWGYLYSGDEEFLRRRAYPVMREVADFYHAYATLGKDGRYHIFPSTPPEQSPWWATDPAIDIALIRTHMAATLEAADILGLDHDRRPGWSDLLGRLADIPTDGNVILDHRNAEPMRPLGHTALMCLTWTAGLIGIASPKEQYDLALRTLRTLPARTSRAVEGYPFPMHTWNDDCCWPNMVGYAARLGLADEARRYLCDYGILQHLKPNGLFAFDIPITEAQRETRWGMPDSGCAMTAVVSEMLLQSYDGAIRLAPAWPRSWDASFTDFLAVGAFEVSAQVVGGRVERLCLRSLKGRPCRLWHPWPGEQVEVVRDGKPVQFAVKDGIIAFQTQLSAEYRIRPRGEDEPAPWRPPHSEGAIQYRGPAFTCEISDAKRVNVWLGMPADEAARAGGAGVER